MGHYSVQLTDDYHSQGEDNKPTGQTRRFLEKAAKIDRLALPLQAIPDTVSHFFRAQIIHNDLVIRG
jgi:hypothetical protein